MLGFILKFMQVRIDAGYDSDAYPHSFCRTAAKTVDLPSMIRTTLALTLPLSLASILALAACETESSQRPGTTKTGSGKKSSGKANAEWSSADLIPGDEMVIEVEVEGDDDGNAADGGQRRVIVRKMVMHGAPTGAVVMEGMPIDLAFAIDGPDGVMPQGQWASTAPSASAEQLPAPTPPPVMLGVRMREVDPILATHLGVTARHASVLEDVAEELNGHASGLRDHDVIVAVNGEAKAGPSDIRRILRTKKAGDTVVFTVVRPSGKTDVTVTLEAFDHAKFLSASPARVGG